METRGPQVDRAFALFRPLFCPEANSTEGGASRCITG